MADAKEEETTMTDAEEEEATVPNIEEEEVTFLDEELSFCLIDNLGDDLPHVPYYKSTGNQDADPSNADEQINVTAEPKRKQTQMIEEHSEEASLKQASDTISDFASIDDKTKKTQTIEQNSATASEKSETSVKMKQSREHGCCRSNCLKDVKKN